MSKPNSLSDMRTFLTVWVGQMVSNLGSRMTNFSLSLWAWDLTGQATALALVVFFRQLPQFIFAPFAGVIVDRGNRKLLMMAGDTAAALSTIVTLGLFLSGSLQIWHLYVLAVINGTFEQLQELAYSASLSLMVPKQHYTRASSLGSVLHYGSSILSPILASSLYYVIGLPGILAIDLATFTIAIATVLSVTIPQPSHTDSSQPKLTDIRKEAVVGFQYISSHPSLVALLACTALFWFAHDFGGALYTPMILARSNNNAQVLGSIASTAGISGVLGAILMSTWSGPKSRIQGMLLGMIGAGCSKIAFGLGNSPLVWIPTQFCSSLNFPLLGSMSDAIWLSKIKPEIQGRVFSARSLVLMITSTLGYLVAAPLADYVFEPAMQPEGWLAGILGPLLGTGRGAGMAFLYVLSSVCLVLVGLGGYFTSNLRQIETNLPDHDPS